MFICSSGPRLGARPTPLRDPGAHNFNPGAGWSSLPEQLPDPFPYRAELDLPVPQRRNCAPTPTKKEHRGPSRLKPPLGFPGPIPAPCSRVWKDWSVCAPALCVCVLRRWISGGRCRCSLRLDGKTAVVTGANGGIGKETSREFAKRGARVIMACRDIIRGEAAAQEIRSSTGNGDVEVKHLDLSSLLSVRSFCEEVLRTEESLHLLVNNAGVMMCPKWLTEDGFEMQIAVNHLGHFLLTNQLLPLLRSSAPSRIINVSSIAHKGGEVDVDDLFFSRRSYSPLKSYRQSKLANVLFTRELSRRERGSGVSCFCLHPGVIRTELGRHVESSFPLLALLLSFPALLFMKTPHEGSQTTVYCAVTPGLESKSGKYFSDCAEKETAAEGRDDETALKLWNESCRLVGLDQD
uniref:Uncharacterized protein n=1 Tax=Knipowitschia caucasica TaxID=637954 RepID=A0AAV2MEF8_KNICA